MLGRDFLEVREYANERGWVIHFTRPNRLPLAKPNRGPKVWDEKEFVGTLPTFRKGEVVAVAQLEGGWMCVARDNGQFRRFRAEVVAKHFV
jgi:hypothetical protein